MKSTAASISIVFFLALAMLSRAQTPVEGAPSTIDYQGLVLDASGAVLAPTTLTNYTMQFRIYDQQAGGTVVWAESQVVTVDKGAFSVRLGTGIPIPVPGGGAREGTTDDLSLAFNVKERYIGLTVIIPGQPNAEITPRLAFLSTPFSLVAERAKSADNAALAGVASSVFQNGGTSTLGSTTITDFTLGGPGRISGANQLEFGTGIANKQVDAGKIGYAPAGTGSLDIFGGGTTVENRKIHLHAEGGLQVDGPLNVTGKITGDGSGLTGISGEVAIGPNSIDLTKLVAAVRESLCPPGTIVAFGGTAAPAGWILCDGRSLGQTDPTYAALYAVIGKNFGGVGTASFNVPDFQGRFLRGSDNGQGRDPDAAARTASRSGGATGDNVGSLQSDALRAHSHSYQDTYFAEKFDSVYLQPGGLPSALTIVDLPKLPAWTAGLGSNGNLDTDNSGVQWARTTGANAGQETRPTNVTVNYIIKY